MIDVKKRTAQLLKEKYGIDEKTTVWLFDESVLQEHNCRRVLIVAEYESRVDIAGKQMLKNHLAEKYCVSLASVEKYVSNVSNSTDCG